MCSVSQDVLYPVEAVVLAGGYVVHQVTAADSLKTGDQVQLHLDLVKTQHTDTCCVKLADYSWLQEYSIKHHHLHIVGHYKHSKVKLYHSKKKNGSKLRALWDTVCQQ